ncbi:MAG: hypothetical protein U0401_22320 [Anaerolineae bacterium]
MKTDKFLIAIIGGIILLVIIAMALVLARGQNEAYVADDTPAGVTQNYFLAVQHKDYERAYGYLADDLKSKPDLDQFIRDMSNVRSEASLKIGETRPGTTTTQVDVSITTYSGGGIFESNSYTSEETVVLRAAPDGQWKLTSFPYPYWGYDWDQEKND